MIVMKNRKSEIFLDLKINSHKETKTRFIGTLFRYTLPDFNVNKLTTKKKKKNRLSTSLVESF